MIWLQSYLKALEVRFFETNLVLSLRLQDYFKLILFNTYFFYFNKKIINKKKYSIIFLPICK